MIITFIELLLIINLIMGVTEIKAAKFEEKIAAEAAEKAAQEMRAVPQRTRFEVLPEENPFAYLPLDVQKLIITQVLDVDSNQIGANVIRLMAIPSLKKFFNNEEFLKDLSAQLEKKFDRELPPWTIPSDTMAQLYYKTLQADPLSMKQTINNFSYSVISQKVPDDFLLFHQKLFKEFIKDIRAHPEKLRSINGLFEAQKRHSILDIAVGLQDAQSVEILLRNGIAPTPVTVSLAIYHISATSPSILSHLLVAGGDIDKAIAQYAGMKNLSLSVLDSQHPASLQVLQLMIKNSKSPEQFWDKQFTDAIARLLHDPHYQEGSAKQLLDAKIALIQEMKGEKIAMAVISSPQTVARMIKNKGDVDAAIQFYVNYHLNLPLAIMKSTKSDSVAVLRLFLQNTNHPEQFWNIEFTDLISELKKATQYQSRQAKTLLDQKMILIKAAKAKK